MADQSSNRTRPPDLDFAIPVIDIAPYLAASSPDTISPIVAQIREAAISPGFFQITGHAIPAPLRDRLFSAIKDFFALPQEVKASLHRNRSTCLRGYEGPGDQVIEEGVLDQKEGFIIAPEKDAATEGLRYGQGPNQWPDEAACPGFRATLMEYFDEMTALSRVLFRLIALGLSLEEGSFDEFVYHPDGGFFLQARAGWDQT